MCAGKRFPVRSGAGVTLGDGTFVTLPGKYKAVLPEKGEWQHDATIAVPAGATITLWGGVTIPASKQAAVQTPAPQAAAGFVDLPGETAATLKSGAALSVPPGATITVSPSRPEVASQILALPGGSDIAVSADQNVTISPWATMAAADVTMQTAAPAPPSPQHSWRFWRHQPPAPPAPSGYRLCLKQPITLPGGAKISVLGRAKFTLPAGTLIAAPGWQPDILARRSCLKITTVFSLPHTSQVIASKMWTMLAAACLTLFGTGAGLGILGVLSYSLSSADLTVRILCVAAAAVAAVVVLVYSVVAIMALADPRPGDALNATSGTSFTL